MNNQLTKNNALSLAEFTLEGGQRLSAETVKNYLGGQNATDQEVLMFLELCKAQKLNPFVRDAYLVKFGSQQAQIIVGKDVFIKRAYDNPNFNGMKAGVVVIDKNGELKEREGALKLPGEELVGGWCEVYLKDKDFPVRSVPSFEEYAQKTKEGRLNSMWSSKGATMIRKVAQSQALREAFPKELRGLYQEEEMGINKNLPQKPIEVGKASTGQKQGILKLASMKGLYSYDDKKKKDTSKLEEFCSSNGFDLQELKFDEVDELIDILSKYEPKETDNPIVDADFKEVEDKEDTEQQASFKEL